MYEIAAARGLKWYFWGRSFMNATTGAALDFVREVTKLDPERWGIECIQSGLFCALNVRNVLEIKWETLLTTCAMSLCDYSARVRLAGFTAKLSLDGSSLLDGVHNFRGPGSQLCPSTKHGWHNCAHPACDLKRSCAMNPGLEDCACPTPLPAVTQVVGQENMGRSAMWTAAQEYYTEKWGSFQCDLEGRIPAWSTSHREITVRQVQSKWDAQSMSWVQTALRQKALLLADNIVNAPGCPRAASSCCTSGRLKWRCRH